MSDEAPGTTPTTEPHVGTPSADQADQAGTSIDPARVRKALGFFKVMAFILGIGLLVLVAEMILHYGFDNGVLDWWPQPHGFIYIVYLIATANLGFAARWGLGRMVLVMLAGCVPFLSFWVEHRVAGQVEAQLAPVERPSDGGSAGR